MTPEEVAKNTLEKGDPLTPEELALLIRRAAPWVRQEIRDRRIAVLPVGKPYRIPAKECRRVLGFNLAVSQ